MPSKRDRARKREVGATDADSSSRDDPREFMDLVAAALLVHNARGELVYCNRAAKSMFHCAQEEPRAALAHMGGPWTEGNEELPFVKALDSGEPVLGQVLAVTGAEDGDTRWIEFNSIPEKAESGEVTRVVSTLVDVTESRCAADDARAMHDRISTIMSSISDGFFAVDENLVILHFNRAAAILLGRKPEDVVGRPLQEAFPELVGSTLEQHYLHAIQTQQAESFELYFDRPPYENWYDVRVYPFEGGLTAYFRVTTDRKIAEQRLRESEKFAQSIADTVPAVVFIYDVQKKRNVWVNRALRQSIGPSIGDRPETADMGAIQACIHPEDREHIDRRLEVLEAAGDGVWEEIEYRYRDDLGRWRWLQDRACVFKRDESGAVVQVIGSAIDITDRKDAELEHVRMEDRMRESQKLESLGLLAGGIAHDFNNLLVGVMGNAGLLLQGMSEDSPMWEIVQSIQESAKRAAVLTGQMLAYSGHGAFVMGLVDWRDVARDVAPLAMAGASGNVTLEMDLTSDIPLVHGDASQLRQVLMNILTNAVEAIGELRGRVCVRSGTVSVDEDWLSRARLGRDLPPGSYVFLSVEDDGVGMAPDTVARMFDPFFSTRFMGRGLGLAAVLGIVRGHGGALRVDSSPGVGTTVTILLPAAHEAGTALHREGETSEPSVDGQSGRLLIADGEPSVLRILVRVLEDAGYEAVQAADGTDALATFNAAPDSFDALVLDVTMGGMGGNSVLEGARVVRPGVPAVLTSGYSPEELQHRIGDKPGVVFLPKPFTPAAVVAAIRRALEGE